MNRDDLAKDVEHFAERIGARNNADDLIGWQAAATDICQWLWNNRTELIAALRARETSGE